MRIRQEFRSIHRRSWRKRQPRRRKKTLAHLHSHHTPRGKYLRIRFFQTRQRSSKLPIVEANYHGDEATSSEISGAKTSPKIFMILPIKSTFSNRAPDKKNAEGWPPHLNLRSNLAVLGSCPLKPFRCTLLETAAAATTENLQRRTLIFVDD